MISKDEAVRILHGSIPNPSRSVQVSLEEALGRVLAEDIRSDLDVPPFDRSAMDGYALRAADLASGQAELEVVEVVKAGMPPTKRIELGQCAQIMTGAPVPEGADTVVMVEQSQRLDDGRVRLEAAAEPGRHIAPRGQDMREGEIVARAGTPVRAIEIGLLATVGRAQVKVWARPEICVIATGDELIPPGAGRPGPGQIRESNGHMLVSQARSLGLGLEARFLGIIPDEPEALRAAIDEGARSDVVIFSGGVSMGEFDFVHTELEARGLQIKIQKIAIKPGKPLLFGSLQAADGREVFVFGLPGNPVSSYVTFELFVRPFLRGLMGRGGPHALEMDACLVGSVRAKAIPRTQHLPARLWLRPEGLSCEVVAWNGSGDLRGLLDANGFLIVPAGEAPAEVGARVRVLATEPDVFRLPPHRSRGASPE